MVEQTRTIEVGFPSVLGYEKLARHTLAWLGPRLGLDAARVADVQTALAEACINAIEHGNAGRASCRVTVTFSYGPTHLDTVVRDEGVRRFEAPAAPPATIEEKLAGLAAPRGMGLLLINQLVDEAEFEAHADDGNNCRLRVYLPDASRPSLSC